MSITRALFCQPGLNCTCNSFRATTFASAPYNQTSLMPVISTAGLGDFRFNDLSAPSDFAGKAGVIQVVDHSPDGVLFQASERWYSDRVASSRVD